MLMFVLEATQAEFVSTNANRITARFFIVISLPDKEIIVFCSNPDWNSPGTAPDPPLENDLVFMFSGFEINVVVLIQIEELFPVDGRKIMPLADSHVEAICFGIAQRKIILLLPHDTLTSVMNQAAT